MPKRAHPVCIEDLPKVALSIIFEFGVLDLREAASLVKVCPLWRKALRQSRLLVSPIKLQQVTDIDLAHIVASFPLITTLNLGGQHITDVGARALGGLPNLQHLVIHKCPGLTTSGVEAISMLTKLRHLHLMCDNARGVGALGALKELRDLWIVGRITESSLEGIENLPNLRKLHLQAGMVRDQSTGLTDRNVLIFAASPTASNLEELELDNADANVLTHRCAVLQQMLPNTLITHQQYAKRTGRVYNIELY
jgi:hypothetical protein